MNSSTTSNIATVRAVIISVSMLPMACASVAPTPIEPIERETELLYGQVQYDLQLEDIILLDPYLDKASPRVDEFEAVRKDLVQAAEWLIEYSVEVIELARVPDGAESVTRFVPVLRQFHSDLEQVPFMENFLSRIDIEAIADEAAMQEDLTRALAVATPLHEAAADAVRALIAETSDRFDLAYEETYDKVVAEHATTMAYTDRLVLRRDEVLNKLLLLESARGGDAAAWETLLSGDERLRERVGADVGFSAEKSDQAESILVERLATAAEIWGYLEPTWTNYQATLQELGRVDANARDVLRLAGLVIESWDHAQRQLAAGRPAGFVAVTKELAYLALKRATR